MLLLALTRKASGEDVESLKTTTPTNLEGSGQPMWAKLGRSCGRGPVACFILIALGFGIHIPSLTGELLWDDIHLINNNPLIRSPILVLEAFRHYLFPDAYEGHYRPVQTISYIADYFFWGKESVGYHVSSVIWHVLSGVLLYYLLRRILGSLVDKRLENTDGNGSAIASTFALFLALVWISHPVHSAAVDYVSGRADSLAFVFASAGWLLFFRARELSSRWLRRGAYALAMLFGLFSLCARESGLLWLLVFLLWLFIFETKTARPAKWYALAACLIIVSSYAGLRQLPEHGPSNSSSAGWNPVTRSVLVLRALGDYGRLLVFPSQLHVERTVYQPALERSQSGWRSAVATEYLSIGGALVLVLFGLGASYRGIGQRTRLFGATWFLLTCLPTSGLVNLNATVAEHWLYLPSVGFCFFVAGVLYDLPTRYLRLAGAVGCLAVVGLSGRSFVRSTDWVDPETFFRRTFAAGGTSSRIGVNLGVIYALRGEHSKAEDILRKVLQAFPNYPVARNNLALALSQQGKTKEAEALLEAANSAVSSGSGGYPRTWDAARNLARLRYQEKDHLTALLILERARVDFPGNWELLALQAQIVHEIEGLGQALPLVEEFVQDHWWHAGASMTLGHLCLEAGYLVEAKRAFWNASRLDVHDPSALNLIALLDLGQNRLEEACQTQRRALARQPDQPRQYLILSDILTKMGRVNEANEAMVQAGRLESLARLEMAAN